MRIWDRFRHHLLGATWWEEVSRVAREERERCYQDLAAENYELKQELFVLTGEVENLTEEIEELKSEVRVMAAARNHLRAVRPSG